MNQAIESMAAMTRIELEKALKLAYGQHQASQQELQAEQQRMQTLLLRLHGVSTALHEMTEALTGLLVLHIQNQPIQVYDRLNTLAARYVRSADGGTLAALAQAAGRVH